MFTPVAQQASDPLSRPSVAHFKVVVLECGTDLEADAVVIPPCFTVGVSNDKQVGFAAKRFLHSLENRLAISPSQVGKQDSDAANPRCSYPRDVDGQMLNQGGGLELVSPVSRPAVTNAKSGKCDGALSPYDWPRMTRWTVASLTAPSRFARRLAAASSASAVVGSAATSVALNVDRTRSWETLATAACVANGTTGDVVRASHPFGSADRNWSSTFLSAMSGIGEGFAKRPARYLRRTSDAETRAALALTTESSGVVKSASDKPASPSTRSASASRSWTLRSAGCCLVTIRSLGRGGPGQAAKADDSKDSRLEASLVLRPRSIPQRSGAVINGDSRHASTR